MMVRQGITKDSSDGCAAQYEHEGNQGQYDGAQDFPFQIWFISRLRLSPNRGGPIAVNQTVPQHHKSTIVLGGTSGGLGAFPSVTRRCSQVSSRLGIFGAATWLITRWLFSFSMQK